MDIQPNPEDDFLRAVEESPDDQPRLVFADWLEERGSPRGQHLRTICAQMQRLQEKLTRLRSVDANRKYFGASAHRYELLPPAPAAVIRDFETKFHVQLPDDYRDFLLRIGDGGAGPYYGLYPLRYAYEEMGWIERGDVAKPFPLDRGWNLEDSKLNYELPDGADVRDGCIMLAHQGCGYWSFLIISGSGRGKVWDDYTTGDGGIHPTGQTFLQWYEDWLDRGLLGFEGKS